MEDVEIIHARNVFEKPEEKPMESALGSIWTINKEYLHVKFRFEK